STSSCSTWRWYCRPIKSYTTCTRPTPDSPSEHRASACSFPDRPRRPTSNSRSSSARMAPVRSPGFALNPTRSTMVAHQSAAEVPRKVATSWAGKLPVYYGWINVVVASVAMTATLPGRTHGLGLITEQLLADLGMTALLFAQINLVACLVGAAFCF